MSGLSAPGASVPEQVVSFALPLAAGMAAAVHPAGARGLAGLTSGVNTMLATREFGRREKADRDLGMRISEMLGQETGAGEIPTGRQVYEGTPTAPGSPEEEAGQGALMPEMRQQKLSDVLGRGQTALIQAAAGTHPREAFGILAGQLAPKPLTPAWHQVTNWDPEKKQNVTTWVDLNDPRNRNIVGRSKPQMSDEDFVKLMQGQGQEQQPATALPDIPVPPAGPPPAGVPPGEIAPEPLSPQPPTSAAPQGMALRPAPKFSYTRTPSGELSIHVAPGNLEWGTRTMRGPDGRSYEWVQERDPASGRVGQWRIQGESAPTDKQSEIEGILESFPIERSDPRYRQLYGLVASRPRDPIEEGVYMKRLYQQFGRRGAPMPQSGAPENAPAQPRTPAPSSSYSPTQSGVIPSPPPASAAGQGLDYGDIQQEAAKIRTQQATERAASEAAATVTARTKAERALPMDPKETSSLLMPDGSSVPRSMTREQAIAAGAREVTPQMREQLAGLDQARAIISGVDSMTKPLIQAQTALGAMRQQAVLHAGALAKTNALAAMYLDSKQAFNGVLSRSIGGERGVLTDRDIIRITQSMPGFGDTAKIRDGKIAMLRILLDTATEAQKRVILGSQSLDEAKTSIEAKVQDLIGKMEATGSTQTAPAPQGKPLYEQNFENGGVNIQVHPKGQ